MEKYRVLPLGFEKSMGIASCKTALGFCNLRCLDFSSISTYPTKVDTINVLCNHKFKITRLIEAENKLKQGINPCK